MSMPVGMCLVEFFDRVLQQIFLAFAFDNQHLVAVLERAELSFDFIEKSRNDGPFTAQGSDRVLFLGEVV